MKETESNSNSTPNSRKKTTGTLPAKSCSRRGQPDPFKERQRLPRVLSVEPPADNIFPLPQHNVEINDFYRL